MDVEKVYLSILNGLQQGSRALIRLTDQEVEDLCRIFESTIADEEPKKLEKILCIIDHTATSHPEFEPLILRSLTLALTDRLMIFSLNCARKHIIVERFKKGVRLQYDFLEILKRLLHSPSPEVVEWTLRTIEECGSQGVYFLKDFDKIKPPPWKWFNQHQRAVREIITMLERRWGKFEKP